MQVDHEISTSDTEQIDLAGRYLPDFERLTVNAVSLRTHRQPSKCCAASTGSVKFLVTPKR